MVLIEKEYIENRNINAGLFIRTDGNSDIGLGHITRCIALAEMLKDSFYITFFCRGIPAVLEKELFKNSFNLIKIENERQFLTQISSKNIVVLDGYGFNKGYQLKVKKCGCKLVCIDDMADREFYADIIINHTPGIKPEYFKAQSFTRYALGPEYALLRPMFLEQAKKKRKLVKIDTILICFGGSDPFNLTEKILKIIIKFPQFKKFVVVTGAEYNEPETLVRLIKKDIRIDYRHSLDEQKMLFAILEADCAIVPASGILYEVLACRTIPISGYYVDNQLKIYEGFRNLGLIIDAGDFTNIIDPINKLCNIETINKFNEKSFDFYSKERIRSIFNSFHP